MHIEIDAWQVRSWRQGDQDAIVRYANNRNVWRNLRDYFPHPYTMRDANAWIDWVKREDPEVNFAIASPNEAIGAVGLRILEDVYRRSAEIGYWLGEPFWDRGITTLALRALSDWAFERFDIVRLQAAVFEWNAASARVLEKAGYEFEARMRQSVTKDGQTIDQLLYARLRERAPQRSQP